MVADFPFLRRLKKKMQQGDPVQTDHWQGLQQLEPRLLLSGTVALTNAVTSLAENADTSGATKMGDIVITDADGGTNVVSLSGTDAASFEVVGSELFLKAGVALDYDTKTSYAVTLTTGSVSVDHTLTITEDERQEPQNVSHRCER